MSPSFVKLIPQFEQILKGASKVLCGAKVGYSSTLSGILGLSRIFETRPLTPEIT
jgi:hypothetical protein